MMQRLLDVYCHKLGHCLSQFRAPLAVTSLSRHGACSQSATSAHVSAGVTAAERRQINRRIAPKRVLWGGRAGDDRGWRLDARFTRQPAVKCTQATATGSAVRYWCDPSG